MIVAINYHYIRENFSAPHPAIFGITPEAFKEQLQELGRHGTFISQQDLRDHIDKGHSIPDRSILITFDDGLREQYEYAFPILNELGIPAVFYINTRVLVEPIVTNVHLIHLVRSQLPPEVILNELNRKEMNSNQQVDLQIDARKLGVDHYKYDTPDVAELKYLLNFVYSADYVERVFLDLLSLQIGWNSAKINQKLYMTEDMIGVLGKQAFIGSHGHDHLPIGQLTESLAKEQVCKAQNLLQKIIGYNPYSFSYPYGSPEAIGNTGPLLSEQGISFALSMNRDVNYNVDTPLCLNRFDNNDVPLGKAFDQSLFSNFIRG